MLGRYAQALPWLQRSIEITPASGRTYTMLALAYEGVGEGDNARAALRQGIEMLPGSTRATVSPSTPDASPAFIAALDQHLQTLVELGLPA